MDQTKRKLFSIAIGIVGLVLAVIALILDFSGVKGEDRGYLLIAGCLLLLLGVFKYPNKHHRKVVHFVFLFPMVFAFCVTVLIHFILGIIYSFTDWNGVEVNKFIGLGNYITMFKQMDFTYSFLITLIFTVINIVMVNIVSFCLALLCTSKIKGRNFYRAA